MLRLERGGEPIINAKVEAYITGPDGYSDYMQLEDFGTGYPDITGPNNSLECIFCCFCKLKRGYIEKGNKIITFN